MINNTIFISFKYKTVSIFRFTLIPKYKEKEISKIEAKEKVNCSLLKFPLIEKVLSE